MNWIAKLLGKQDDADVGYSSEEKEIFASSFRIGWTVVAFGIGGLGAIALWANGTQPAANVHFTAFFGADLLVAAAAASAGALFGFIFGISRTLDPASQPPSVSGTRSQRPRRRASGSVAPPPPRLRHGDGKVAIVKEESERVRDIFSHFGNCFKARSNRSALRRKPSTQQHPQIHRYPDHLYD